MDLKYMFPISPPLQKTKLHNIELGIALSSWLNGLGPPLCKHLFSAEPKLHYLPFLFVFFVSVVLLGDFFCGCFFFFFSIKQNIK